MEKENDLLLDKIKELDERLTLLENDIQSFLPQPCLKCKYRGLADHQMTAGGIDCPPYIIDVCRNCGAMI